jgi:hypothetical protein
MSRSPIEIAIASETSLQAGHRDRRRQAAGRCHQVTRGLGDAEGADRLERSLRDAQKATSDSKTRPATLPRRSSASTAPTARRAEPPTTAPGA